MTKLSTLFIPYELAVLAKEKGFDEPCLAYYVNNKGAIHLSHFNISANENEEHLTNSYNESIKDITIIEILAAPLYSQVVNWFREKHEISIEVSFLNLTLNRYWILDIAYMSEKRPIPADTTKLGFKTYYEALTNALEEAFKLIPND